MKNFTLLFAFLISVLAGCDQQQQPKSEFADVSSVAKGHAAGVMMTGYSTTLLANGRDHTRLRIVFVDSIGRELSAANGMVELYITGDGRVYGNDFESLLEKVDSAGKSYFLCMVEKGVCNLNFVAGTKPDKVKIEAKSGKLWPGGHEIHTLPASFAKMKPTSEQIKPTTKPIDKMIGADISWLPELEARGKKFYENGQEIDAFLLLKEHGFNYIRLRLFVNPANPKGYSPEKGFCDLPHTLAMAKRIKEAGMKFLLDFHYSDYWADPQQQYKPLSWETTTFATLNDSVKIYTTAVLMALKNQGTVPDMVQVGNEINHGMIWPDGHISQPDQLAQLLQSGVAGVLAVEPSMPIMLHIALGGQNEESVFWLDNMIARGVSFDVIGISYYPRWHGTLDDLKFNLTDLTQRYQKPIVVVEYSDYKKEVHDIVFALPNQMGKGAAIWEPLNQRSGLFDKDGNATDLFKVYDELNVKYLKN